METQFIGNQPVRLPGPPGLSLDSLKNARSTNKPAIFMAYTGTIRVYSKNIKAMDQLLTKVKGHTVLFDDAPPLELARAKDPREYWLVRGDVTVRRVYRGMNIIEDLYRAMEFPPFSGLPPAASAKAPQVEVYLSPRDMADLAVEPKSSDRPGEHHQNACCCYSLQAGELRELYPSERACAKDLGLSYHAVHACNWGNTAVIKGDIIATTHYLTREELGLRRIGTERFGSGVPQRVYVYDYSGEAVGVFATMADATHELQLDYRVVRRGLLNPDRLYQGYYFYLDPGRRPRAFTGAELL